MKRIPLITVLMFLALAGQTLAAQEFDAVFKLFLSKLVERHGQLETITMPETKTITVPGEEDEALYMLYFINEEDSQIFTAAVEKENIPYFIFSENATQIGLVYSDLLIFLMKVAIGL